MADYSTLYSALDQTNLTGFLLFTDLRLKLVYPATDGNELIGQPTDLMRYYYAISDIDIVAGFVLQLE